MYYYELLHSVPATSFSPAVGPGIYAEWCAPDDFPRLAYAAERIWFDNGKKVVYRKHRECEPPVDMKEFTWIKLTAKEIK